MQGWSIFYSCVDILVVVGFKPVKVLLMLKSRPCFLQQRVKLFVKSDIDIGVEDSSGTNSTGSRPNGLCRISDCFLQKSLF